MDNCSERNYARINFSPTTKVWVNVFYLVTSLSALIGNSIVIKVYAKANYPNKLKLFFINLAIADILNAVLCIPFTYTELIYGQWIAPPVMCPIGQFFQYLCVYVSAITLTTISIERFVAILSPFSKLHHLIDRHPNRILFIIWFTGVLYSCTGTLNTKIVLKNSMNESFFICEQHVDQEPDISIEFTIANFCLTYAIPLIIMSILYTILITKLVKIMNTTLVSCSENSFNSDIEKDCPLRRNSGTFAKTKIVKMLIIVVISYMICMTPAKVRQMIYWIKPEVYRPLYCPNPEPIIWIKLLFNWLFTVHSVVNPIIYSFLCENFRKHLSLDYQLMKNKLRSLYSRKVN